MFTDPVFRIALTLSLLAHVSVIAPMALLGPHKAVCPERAVELNYIVIKQPELTADTENFAEKIPSSQQELQSSRELIPGYSSFEQAASEEKVFTEKVEKKGKDVERQKALLEYYNLIRERIRAEVYSVSSSQDQGEVILVFTIDPSGGLFQVEGTLSAGSPAVKRKAVSGVKKAAPFPPFPRQIGTKPIKFSLTVSFATE